MRITKPLRISATVLLAGVVGVAAGAGISQSVAQPKTTQTPHATEAERALDYKKNANGQTYGSALGALKPTDEPDLILVVMTNGSEGYVRKSDLDPPVFTSPKAALAWQARVGSKPRTVPAFKSDGRTKIGFFSITPES